MSKDSIVVHRLTFGRNGCEQPVRIVPADGVHVRVNVSGRLGAVVNVIGVFVHIERQNGLATGEGMTVVGRPLIDQPSVARSIGQEHPTGPPSKRLTHGDEFRAPAIEGTEITRNDRAELLSGPAFIAKTIKARARSSSSLR